MIDIRAVSKIFLDFIYDNNILPNAIMRIIEDSEKEKDSQKHIKYDISVILNILRQRDEYVARNDFYSTYNMLKCIENARDKLSERELDTPIYKWLNDAEKTLDTLIQIRNNFFHDVSKKMDGDTFLALIRTLIKYVPEGYEKNEYLKKLEKFDEQQKTPGTGNGYDEGRALRRIPRWAKHPEQINSKIIWSFFKAEAEYGGATKSLMRQLCKQRELQEKFFDTNYAAMKSDAGKNHGKTFEDDGENVWIWDFVKSTLLQYKADFYKE